MTRLISLFLLLSTIIASHSSTGQTVSIDTMVDVGGYQLHFHIVPGKGTPILFESGGGDDASVWNELLPQIERLTHAPLIAYDRAGFGKSSFDTTRHGLLDGVKGLEAGLQKLGYTTKMMLVAHSQGGIYAQLYAFRHPRSVAAAVLIDVTTACFYHGKRLAATQKIIDNSNAHPEKPGPFYQGADFSRNLALVGDSPFPTSIPVTDFVSERTPFKDSSERAEWKQCHHQFAAIATNRIGIEAYGCGHYIYQDNPLMIILAIARTYAGFSETSVADAIRKRTLDYAVEVANGAVKK